MSARDELARLLERATPGPWRVDLSHGGSWWAPDGVKLAKGEDDADLIVWLRNRADRLLALWEAAELVRDESSAREWPEIDAALAALEDTDAD